MKERILGKITLLKYVINFVVYTRHKKPISDYDAKHQKSNPRREK